MIYNEHTICSNAKRILYEIRLGDVDAPELAKRIDTLGSVAAAEVILYLRQIVPQSGNVAYNPKQ
jgi:hypothetical protein